MEGHARQRDTLWPVCTAYKMRTLVLLFSLFWVATSEADDSALAPTPYENAEHNYRIMFPESWTMVTPNKTFTHVKARAPQGYASMSVASRDSLWRDDKLSTRYKDAWLALDGISITTFTNNFERSTSSESSVIFSVAKTTLGKEKAVKVDYVLTNAAKGASVRIRSFSILHSNQWYSVNCATSPSEPDLFLDLMIKAASTFEFYNLKQDR
jgi:hypothetical protein